MPTYQYACTSCGHRFEAQQAFTDATLTECPECSGRLRKVFSSVGIVFKGSGFYRTDSRSAPVVAGSSSEGKSESKSESKSSESSGSGDSSSGKSSSSSGSSGSSGSSSSTTAKAS
ncbi:MAG: hypothetical protein QOK26_1178 [Pseudonocardiales bacterium]|nr:hypothetical protein [Pseudonocardiales bacterium]